ncbi:MAG TPA: MerR family transcriptional regulator [Thermaerobacter sp.]
MPYTVKQLADIAGVSVRTLHYYDEIGLLKPTRYGENGYRYYDRKALLRLQQILFSKQLGFSLREIKEIIDKPGFDVLKALEAHKQLLLSRIAGLNQMVMTIDKTIQHMKGELEMDEREFFTGLDRERIEKYRQEARKLFGAEVVEESERRVRQFTPEKWSQLTKEFDSIITTVKSLMDQGYDHPDVQRQVARLHGWLNNYYDCSYERLLGVGRMYKEHPDFVAMFRSQYGDERIPDFLHRAIEHYVLKHQG